MPSPQERVAEILNYHIPEGDFVASEVSDKFLAYMQEQEPELLREWMEATLHSWTRHTVRSVLQSRRAQQRRRMRAGAFQQALEEAEGGNIEPLRNFQIHHTVDEHNTKRPVGKMTGTDHLFVAERMDQQGRNLKLLAAFHRAVAQQVGDRPTEEVMSENDYARLYNSIIEM